MLDSVKKRNDTLYTLRFIACFFIVTIHAPFPNALGELCTYTARFAVPFFFMITGYFGYHATIQKLKKRRRRIFVLSCQAFIAYFFLNMAIFLVHHSLSEFLQTIFNLRNILFFAFCNWTSPLIGVGHLWYLFAILYVYFIVIHFTKDSQWKRVYHFAILAIMLDYSFQIVRYLNGAQWTDVYWRNFLFFGLPMYAIGHWLHDMKVKNKINKKLMFQFGGGGALLYVIEFILYRGGTFELYLSSIMISIALFMFALLKPNVKSLSIWGQKYTTDIYVAHYAFVIIIAFVIKFLGWQQVALMQYLYPIIVFVSTWGLAALWKSEKKFLLNNIDKNISR